MNTTSTFTSPTGGDLPTLSAETQARVERRLKIVFLLASFQGALIAALVHVLSLKGTHSQLVLKYGDLMAKTQAELMQEIADLKQAIVDDSASDQAVVTKLDGIVTDLKGQVAALQAAGIDTDALFASLEDAKSAVAGVTSTTDSGGETDIPVGG